MLQSIIQVIIILSLLFCVACNNASSDHRSINTVIDSEVYPNSKNKPGVYNSESRAAWQKPDIVINKLGDISGAVIADIGAGTGYFSFRLALKSKKVIAVDIDSDMLELINLFITNLPVELRSKIETRQALPDNPNIKEEEVDIIVIINTMAYIKDRKSYLSNLKKCLKKKGKLMILNFKKKNNCTESPVISDRISLETMTAELSAVGFTPIETDTSSLDHQYIIISAL